MQRYKTALISVSASRVAPDEPLELRVDRQLHEPVILRRRCCRCCARILAARRVDIELECRVVGQHSRAPRPVGGSKVVEQLAFYVGHLPAYTGAGAGHLGKRSASRRLAIGRGAWREQGLGCVTKSSSARLPAHTEAERVRLCRAVATRAVRVSRFELRWHAQSSSDSVAGTRP